MLKAFLWPDKEPVFHQEQSMDRDRHFAEVEAKTKADESVKSQLQAVETVSAEL